MPGRSVAKTGLDFCLVAPSAA